MSKALLHLEARSGECNWLFWSFLRETAATSVIINCTVTCIMHVNFITKCQKFLSFFILLVYWGGYFPIMGKEILLCEIWKCTVEWVWKIFVGRPNFSVGEGVIGFVTWGVFKFIPKFTYFALAWIINFSNILIFTSYWEGNTQGSDQLWSISQNTNQTGCLFKVPKNASEFYFLGECFCNKMDLEEGVNCTNLLNVFLEVVSPPSPPPPPTLKSLTLPDLSLFLPTTLSKEQRNPY